MRDDLSRALILLGLLGGFAGLAQGCATSGTAQVQELEPGTYSIGVNRSSSYLSESNAGLTAAVDKAGAHCHAKGQKFLLKSAIGKTVVFRCVPMNPGAPAQATAQAPQPLPPPPAQ